MLDSSACTVLPLSTSVCASVHFLRADINGLRRLTAGVYRRRQANMRGQHFILFSVNVSAYTCVSNITAKVISTLWKCNGRGTVPVGSHYKMKSAIHQRTDVYRGIIASRDCIWAADIWSYAGTRVFYSLSVNWEAVTSSQAANGDLTLFTLPTARALFSFSAN